MSKVHKIGKIPAEINENSAIFFVYKDEKRIKLTKVQKFEMARYINEGFSKSGSGLQCKVKVFNEHAVVFAKK